MIPEAYIKGVLDGDGDIDRGNVGPRLRLQTVSKPFADFFANNLSLIGLIPRYSENNRTRTFNGYTWNYHCYTIRATCTENCVQKLSVFPIEENEFSRLSYLIGFFHSEGHFHVKRYSNRECWEWRVTNKDTSKLERIRRILLLFGIKSALCTYPNIIPFLQIQRRCDIEQLQNLGVKKK